MIYISMALILIGALGMFAGGLGVLIAAFRESLSWGLASLFLPGVVVFFIFTHWDEACEPAKVWGASVLALIVGVGISVFAVDSDSIGATNSAWRHELEVDTRMACVDSIGAPQLACPRSWS